jgi:hypothetical protein
MTPEQKKVWDILSNNYACNAIHMTENLKNIFYNTKKRREYFMHKKMDSYMYFIMDTYPIEEIVRIVKTWLNSGLPIDPSRLKSYDKFHKTCSVYVFNNMGSIKNYL